MGDQARFVLVQLSDPHIGASWAGTDSLARLDATVDAVRELRDRPEAILISGDLAEHGGAAEYTAVRERVASIGARICALPGNHDDRETLRRAFSLVGEHGAPVHSSVDLGALRLVMLDTTLPGTASGDIDDGALSWLETELSIAPDTPTVLAMHHPPLSTGSPAWDRIGLPLSAHTALETVLRRHPQVLRVVAGHVHRAVSGELAGRVVIASPSIYAAAKLDLAAEKIAFSDAPPAFTVHVLTGGRAASHVEPVSYTARGSRATRSRVARL